MPTAQHYAGIATNIAGSIFAAIGFGFIKRGHNTIHSYTPAQIAALGGMGWATLKNGQWVFGFFLQSFLSTCCDLTAISLAPANLLTPLAGCTLIFNVYTAPLLLTTEYITHQDVIAALVMTAGICLIVIYGPTDEAVITLDFVKHHFTTVTYLCALSFIMISDFCSLYCAKKIFGNKQKGTIHPAKSSGAREMADMDPENQDDTVPLFKTPISNTTEQTLEGEGAEAVNGNRKPGRLVLPPMEGAVSPVSQLPPAAASSFNTPGDLATKEKTITPRTPLNPLNVSYGTLAKTATEQLKLRR